MLFEMHKTAILIIFLINFCNAMQTSHSLKTSINLTNKINSPSTSGMAENVVIPSGSVKIRQGSKFCDIKFSKKSLRFLPIMAASGESTNKIPSGAMPNRFSYENQLKIMLENQKNFKRINAKISFGIYRKIHINVPDDVYSFFALRAAIMKIKTLKSKHQNEAEYVFQIVAAMRESIKKLNSYAKKTPSSAIINEQLRFIGLVLGHLLLRENPIFNVANNEFAFTARIEPDIDALNLSACGMLVNKFDEELKAQLIEENLENSEIFQNENDDSFCEFFENLNKKVARGLLEPGESEKWVELNQKALLFAKYGPEIPYYTPIMRAFIVFGKEAPKLILLFRALLSGCVDETQLDEYLNAYFKSKKAKLATNCKQCQILEKQLISLSKRYGL